MLLQLRRANRMLPLALYQPNAIAGVSNAFIFRVLFEVVGCRPLYNLECSRIKPSVSARLS